ncbi:hypothetical protein DASB73_039080 [Starmerella bacillaris]|uniref:C2H2-type domain-containing protein n=1 Tax=Starmerella bacillaris TaxID=1247836 RepID=A0AAV5RN37_STABA|nr:hypothetical protein DASB73_039080 [Starmerella bacillaris]
MELRYTNSPCSEGNPGVRKDGVQYGSSQPAFSPGSSVQLSESIETNVAKTTSDSTVHASVKTEIQVSAMEIQKHTSHMPQNIPNSTAYGPTSAINSLEPFLALNPYNRPGSNSSTVTTSLNTQNSPNSHNNLNSPNSPYCWFIPVPSGISDAPYAYRCIPAITGVFSKDCAGIEVANQQVSAASSLKLEQNQVPISSQTFSTGESIEDVDFNERSIATTLAGLRNDTSRSASRSGSQSGSRSASQAPSQSASRSASPLNPVISNAPGNSNSTANLLTAGEEHELKLLMGKLIQKNNRNRAAYRVSQPSLTTDIEVNSELDTRNRVLRSAVQDSTIGNQQRMNSSIPNALSHDYPDSRADINGCKCMNSGQHAKSQSCTCNETDRKHEQTQNQYQAPVPVKAQVQVQVQVHEKSNDAEDRPFICELDGIWGGTCLQTFKRPYDLQRHKETVHGMGARNHTCRRCSPPRNFSRQDSLDRHQRKLHGVYGVQEIETAGISKSVERKPKAMQSVQSGSSA